ncbi:AAA family ATPase [Aeromonas veronii]|uniref:AAA family ATPase n=1 Tax=Aeromonas veronii TaxID=654 RepID=UPI003D1E00DB
MLKEATFKNFTSLPSDTLFFGPGLNVIVAENGCGKTHLLKAIYSLLSVNTGGDLAKSSLQKAYADKLMGVFRPESLGKVRISHMAREHLLVTH